MRDVLTSREEQVLRLLAKGSRNKAIAHDLNIAVGTVKAHVKSIMSKLNARCRTEAASIATGRGLVDVPEHSLAEGWQPHRTVRRESSKYAVAALPSSRPV
ncbi:MAG TPA: response regulator transcription factor [Ramlibacter sp.]|uniref:response regulator transcription factor n=1 Tax=Ramlibacter sp. TaxID=1917967 RepID=UPI002B5C7436|nr:response regulator transcription factor [Ramlibacter sp.]HVZ45514.1 response regulator transcription factor [Ramlibacter sp.]